MPSDSASLPRIRGGVSRYLRQLPVRKPSSPHTRGCFFEDTDVFSYAAVFPAYAGVFPSMKSDQASFLGLPRIRGGVSRPGMLVSGKHMSSPHTRGCFLTYGLNEKKRLVFPAYAGVFPAHRILHNSEYGLPRIRGGVSQHLLIYRSKPMSSPHTRGCFQR